MNDSKNIVLEFTKAAVFLNKNQLLKDVDMKISQGDFVYFMGSNGSGKSSLMRCIYAGLPLQGQARVLEYQLNGIKAETLPLLRRRLGIVSAEFPLISHLNLEENLMIVLKATGWTDKNHCLNRINELLTKFGLQQKQQSAVSALGRAEKSRALLVRALLNSPGILLLDEPTAGLDEKAAEAFMSLIRELNQKNKLTVIVASSDAKLPESFPGKVYLFSEGTLRLA